MSTRSRTGNPAASLIAVAADIAALILGLWILFYLLDANQGNALVEFIRDAARFLAGWSNDLFTFEEQWARVVAGYGLPAIVYLFVGHTLAGAARRH
jgi:hypothetical protein